MDAKDQGGSFRMSSGCHDLRLRSRFPRHLSLYVLIIDLHHSRYHNVEDGKYPYRGDWFEACSRWLRHCGACSPTLLAMGTVQGLLIHLAAPKNRLCAPALASTITRLPTLRS